MSLVDRYLFRITLAAFITALGSLTAVIWLTQSLRQVDLLTAQRQTLVIFFTLTGLTVPSLVVVIAPIALFIAILFCLNKFNADSELVVASAAGLSPQRLMRPFAILTLLVAILVGWLALVAMPDSFRAIRDLLMTIRADFLTHVVREGQFVTLDEGFTFHYRERGANNALLGIFIQDRRDPAHITTYIAEAGATVARDGQNYLVLEKGSVQRQNPDARDPAIVTFENYAIDLAQFGGNGEGTPLKPRERSTAELWRADPNDAFVAANRGAFRSELHDRLVNPLYAIVLAAIAFAALAEPRTTRQGRGLAIAAAIGIALGLRVAGFGASALLAKNAWALALVYGLPLIGLAGALWHAFGARWSDLVAAQRGSTAGPAFAGHA